MEASRHVTVKTQDYTITGAPESVFQMLDMLDLLPEDRAAAPAKQDLDAILKVMFKPYRGLMK
jgi:hypothetical protein